MEQERYVLLGWITGRTGEREITFQPMAANTHASKAWIGKQMQVHVNNPECIAWDLRLSHTIYILEIGALPLSEMDAVFGTLAITYCLTPREINFMHGTEGPPFSNKHCNNFPFYHPN